MKADMDLPIISISTGNKATADAACWNLKDPAAVFLHAVWRRSTPCCSSPLTLMMPILHPASQRQPTERHRVSCPGGAIVIVPRGGRRCTATQGVSYQIQKLEPLPIPPPPERHGWRPRRGGPAPGPPSGSPAPAAAAAAPPPHCPVAQRHENTHCKAAWALGNALPEEVLPTSTSDHLLQAQHAQGGWPNARASVRPAPQTRRKK